VARAPDGQFVRASRPSPADVSFDGISQRFQNRRLPGGRDPLARLDVDPLRPLNHLLWNHIQGEGDRLSVLRRAHEYEAEYGFPLHGKAVADLRTSERRSKFIEAFHNLLHRCVQFYRVDDDTTHVADGFPVLNALKETHFHDLGVFGEQLLASIRWDNWSAQSDPNYGKQWAREWRPEVQGYIHALRAVLGVDLAADISNVRDEAERYLPPSVHLRRRLAERAYAP
jgi:hypothetical protein